MHNKEIIILFSPGMHGHFFCFCLNKMIHGNNLKIDNPFTKIGTSKVSYYDEPKSVFAYHYTENPFLFSDKNQNNFIFITLDEQDALLFLQARYFRANDIEIDINNVHHDFYHKMKNKFNNKYGTFVQTLKTVNQYTNLYAYNDIKDSSWPDIYSLDDYYDLPNYIRQECTKIYNFYPWYISEKYPDCPKGVARIYLKTLIGDLHAELNNIDTFINLFEDKDKLFFNVKHFYDYNDFKEMVYSIQKKFNLTFDLDEVFLKDIHNKFISNVVYANSKKRCDVITNAVHDNQNISINLTLDEEAWILYYFEKYYSVNSVYMDDSFFKNTQDLQNYFEYQSREG